MAAERLSMRKLRELLRQRLELKLSVREIARSLGIGVGTVNRYLYRAQAAKLTSWPLAPELDDDAALTALLFADEGKVVTSRPEPDWAHVHAELRRKGVTRLLLWQEYREAHPEGYQYSQFCERYARWARCVSVTMRQEHRAGEKCFMDFSGDGLQVHDAVSGEVRVAKLYVAVMRKLGKSRRQLFEEVEKVALKPLPDKPYEVAHWKKARVNVDYHVELEGHYYSVPYGLVGQQVEVRSTPSCVEVLQAGRRVASHVRSQERGRHTTQAEHMPASHRAHAQWTPSRILSWAATIGPNTAALVEELMKRRPHPEQGFRSALGVIRLAHSHGQQRVEKACARAVRHRAYSYKSVAAILQNHLEEVEVAHEDKGALPAHENVRGAGYYH